MLTAKGKTMRTMLTAALLLLTATPALAEADWVLVSKGANGTNYFIDRSSISITGPIRRYWERWDFVNDPKGWKQMKLLQEANCASGQVRTLQVSVYMVDGTNSGVTAPDQSWQYVTPDTVGSTLHDSVCGK